MKLTYWLMVLACVTFSASQVLVSHDWAFDVEAAHSATHANDAVLLSPAAMPDYDLARVLDSDDADRPAEKATSLQLARDPFDESPFVAASPIVGSGGVTIALPVRGPFDSTSSRLEAEVAAAGRMSSSRLARTSGREMRPASIDSQSRISRRLRGTTSMFEETRFGAIRQKRTHRRRPARRSSAGGTVIRTTR
ncbi:MAG: hypothetical protein ACYTGG_04250 [Planctomycetota bacterium]|jgi:hypothetical protein